MPPTRGHDLKLLELDRVHGLVEGMPPTRGHDLKLEAEEVDAILEDAPHTGARLETGRKARALRAFSKDAPHTGARLETFSPIQGRKKSGMPPTRGHDLKRREAEKKILKK